MQKLIVVASLLSALAAVPSRANACTSVGQVVTYYSEPDKPFTSTDPRCSLWRLPSGTVVCRVRLRGVLYMPQNLQVDARLPAIIYNHGSEHSFDADDKACGIADYFVARNFAFFVPFRRGQGEIATGCFDDPAEECVKADPVRASTLSEGCELGKKESSGMYVSQALKEDPSRGLIEVLDEQTADVIEAVKYMRARPDIAYNEIVLMGSSYGGIMTVLTNAKGGADLGSGIGVRAAVAFSPGGISWSSDDGDANTDVQEGLMAAAALAKTSTYFLQGQWDFDTRASIELAYVQAGSGANMHSPPFALQIFETKYPDDDPCNPGQKKWHDVHVGFARATTKWGPSVIDFLARNGVQ
jgi:pimeloyl-ACP methyl ester carboxylesterase